MGIVLYPGLTDPDMAGEAERRSPPSSRGQGHMITPTHFI